MKYRNFVLLIILIYAALFTKAQEVQVSRGVNVSIDGPVQLVLDGMGITNHGQFKAENGTVVFNSTSKSGRAYIGGSNPIFLHNLSVDCAFGDLQLENRLFVTGKLSMMQGNLDLNNYSIDLGSSGAIEGESRNARITGKNGGYVRVTADLNAPNKMDPGNLGLQLTSNGKLGRTTITRGHVQQINDIGELSIQRYYEIGPTYPSDIRAEVVADFLDVESANVNPLDIALWSSNDGGRKWSAVKKSDNIYVINRGASTDPIRLTYFSGRLEDRWPASTILKLYPNPVAEKFVLTFTYPKEEEIIINLYGSNGQLLESRKIKTFNGINKIDWQVGKYPGGNYQLRFAGEKMKTLSFTKQ